MKLVNYKWIKICESIDDDRIIPVSGNLKMNLPYDTIEIRCFSVSDPLGKYECSPVQTGVISIGGYKENVQIQKGKFVIDYLLITKAASGM